MVNPPDSDQSPHASPPGLPPPRTTPTDSRKFKGQRGLRRLLNALSYSRDGLRVAWRQEDAVRQEVWLLAVGIPLALALPLSGVEKALLVAVLFLVLVVELLNTAIEATVDRHSYEINPLAKQAKDFGSAAVLVSIILALSTWAVILGTRFLA